MAKYVINRGYNGPSRVTVPDECEVIVGAVTSGDEFQLVFKQNDMILAAYADVHYFYEEGTTVETLEDVEVVEGSPSEWTQKWVTVSVAE